MVKRDIKQSVYIFRKKHGKVMKQDIEASVYIFSYLFKYLCFRKKHGKVMKQDIEASVYIFSYLFKYLCFRKKHGKVMKQEIEASIGYNKYVLESPSLVDSFHSPDTICKYCGIDFKFFRALKHHLRSHSSCRLKPFLCQKCDVGFSTKANCVRHLQKQHPEISQHHIENWIHVNEPSLLEDGEQGFSDGRDSVSPAESYDNTGIVWVDVLVISQCTHRHTGLQ